MLLYDEDQIIAFCFSCTVVAYLSLLVEEYKEERRSLSELQQVAWGVEGRGSQRWREEEVDLPKDNIQLNIPL